MTAGPPGSPFDARDVPAHLRDVTVCTHGAIDRIGPPAWPPGVQIEEIDHGDPAGVERWLAVHRVVYGETWSAAEFDERVAGHPWFAVHHTFVASDAAGPVGIASIGTFRRNGAVGIGHYLGVDPRARGRGLARALLTHRYRVLHAHGIDRAESHTHLGRLDAIGAHFAAGFVPKTELDHWNPPPRPDHARFVQASEVLVDLHERWTLSRAPS